MSERGGFRSSLDAIAAPAFNAAMKRLGISIFAALIVGSGCRAVERAPESNPQHFASRDGRAEALADQHTGKPILLYGHVTDGIVAGMRSTVAISNCEATHYLPDLFIREGAMKSEGELQLMDSALKFAADYNMTTFSERRAEVLERCPDAKLESLGSFNDR